MKTNYLTECCLLGIACAGLAGCGQATDKGVTTAPVKQAAAHSHEGWWCAEHGVPEEVCAQCNKKVAGEFKTKGDWCQEHDCPESQCFACHPEKEADFVVLYEAKYGSKPPKRE